MEIPKYKTKKTHLLLFQKKQQTKAFENTLVAQIFDLWIVNYTWKGETV